MAFNTAAQEFQYMDKIMKEMFAPAIVNQVYKKSPFWAQIQKRFKGVYGKRVTIPISLTFSEAVGANVADSYALPVASKSTWEQVYIYQKRNYGRIQVDGFAIESAKGKGGWVEIVAAESKNIANSFAIDIDRQSMGRGDGVLAHVNQTAATGTSIGVDNAFGITGDTLEHKLFRIGMKIDSQTTSAADGISNATITAIDTSAHTITWVGNETWADNDKITRVGAWSATAADMGEMMGLDGIVDSGHPLGSTFQGVSRSSNEVWQAYEDSTAQVIGETVLQEGLDAIDQRTDGPSPNLALTTYALRNKLIDLIRGDRMVTTMDLKAGWKAIKYVGGNVELPIMVHKHCPAGYFYYISLPHITFYALKKLVWDNKGGGIVKPVADYDAYEAWLTKNEPGSKNSSNSGKADDANPEPSHILYKGMEGVETRRGASFTDEGIVQTTNAY